MNLRNLTPTAPKKGFKMRYRVKGFDSFSAEWWDSGEYATKEEALAKAKSFEGTMTLAYVYEDDKQIYKGGTF
jgi:hypothetical protein